MKDLMIVNFWDCYLAERFPVTYNHLFYGGYLNMPSARMGTPGKIGLGYAHVPPYCLYNFRAQLVERLEFSGNYRIFKGVYTEPQSINDWHHPGRNTLDDANDEGGISKGASIYK